MKWTMLALFAAATGLLATAPTSAQDKKKKEAISDPEVLFKKVDADESGSLNLEEFKMIKDYLPLPKLKKSEKPPEYDFEKLFAQLDRNNDKKLLMDEFKNIPTLIPAMAKKK